MPVKIAPSSENVAAGMDEVEPNVYPGDEAKLEADRLHTSLEIIRSHGCLRCTLTHAQIPWIANDEPYDGSRIQCPYLMRREVRLTPQQEKAVKACQVPELYARVYDGEVELVHPDTPLLRDQIAQTERDLHLARHTRDPRALREAEQILYGDRRNTAPAPSDTDKDVDPGIVKQHQDMLREAGEQVERLCPNLGEKVRRGETIEKVFPRLKRAEKPKPALEIEPTTRPPAVLTEAVPEEEEK